MIEYVTDIWIQKSKPKGGNIKFLNYVITRDGVRFDYSKSILSPNVDDDFYVGTWFKNTIWGNCRFQPSIDLPQGNRSADLRLFGNFELINEQTIEIKTIRSKRRDVLVKRLKEAQGQSSNVLIDITAFPFGEITVKNEIERYVRNHYWLKTIIVKKGNNLLFVWKIQ